MGLHNGQNRLNKPKSHECGKGTSREVGYANEQEEIMKVGKARVIRVHVGGWKKINLINF